MRPRLLALCVISFFATAAGPVAGWNQLVPANIAKALPGDGYEIVYRVADFPRPLYKALESRIKPNPLMADPGRPFNATDVIDLSRPRRRLVFAGGSKTAVFVVYQHGGRGMHLHFAAFARQGDGAALLFSGRFTTLPRNFDGLKTLISEDRIGDETAIADRHGYW